MFCGRVCGPVCRYTLFLNKNIVFRAENIGDIEFCVFRMTVVLISFKGNRSMDVQYSMLTWLILLSYLFLLALPFRISVQLHYM